jgi:hypothetical protein
LILAEKAVSGAVFQSDLVPWLSLFRALCSAA